VARVRDLWGLSRAGSRIHGAVQGALKHAMRKGTLEVEDFCYHQKGKPIRLRDRSQAASRTLRKPELLPPQEIREAILVLVRESHGMRREEVATAVARLLGFLATSQQLRDTIEGQVEALLSDDKLAIQGSVLVMQADEPAPA
jgi:hypothetical protein